MLRLGYRMTAHLVRQREDDERPIGGAVRQDYR